MKRPTEFYPTLPNYGERLRLEHLEDFECDVDPYTLCCRQCGAYHGDPCPLCQRYAFHASSCILTEAGLTYHPAAEPEWRIGNPGEFERFPFSYMLQAQALGTWVYYLTSPL